MDKKTPDKLLEENVRWSQGNQQNTVLARSFLHDARVVLIDEPTQGVDAKARFDIYGAIRAKADQGVACIVNSSDALELAGLCDRVLVFSRGRIVRELVGSEISEEKIVSSFLKARDVALQAKIEWPCVATEETTDIPSYRGSASAFKDFEGQLPCRHSAKEVQCLIGAEPLRQKR